MQHKLSLIGSLGLALNGMAAYVPSEPWSTLTPEGSLAGTITDYSYTFGIAINPVTAEGGKKVKRDVVTQIGDGQIQATTATPSSTSTAAVVTQIGDGQIQATTSTASAAAVVTQIGDGQIQATTATPSTTSAAGVVTQIGDGQIQADTTTSSAAVVTQIGDGQIQATTSKNTVSAASQISDGQVQASGAATNSAEAAAQNDSENPVDSVSCWNENALSMTLNGTILTDSQGRIGSIVANRQFQFDGPPPQAGAIYAAGWSITDEGRLAIGNTTEFYQCLSGSFYNLYDQHIGSQCEKVYLDVIDLVKC
ncbi:hypothetical protein KL905_001062 [Ogataea polymorpha]|uniref:Cell wall mannoprotein PIR1-like C-terminal domain-containing protein n=1 Tax=Ogataea polymorpha TaxID=460523 RepID=A0A1B7SKZ5_9ASCO|nr:uncharacterized protein OGAPODRAFT_15512 [Ogataea polymorpha]KAG7877796.1 hypothetical protein KL937_004309 [Ogataea polymorpha]KAG7896655.1 hypothetical protein KL908_000057 [Ogataea polymorpha]KAG7903542.1 hypothetical protein KL935_001074 [Ogataea polymorpha]KAG7911853.1 hypothetical protein KL906_000057 [Ogataea polymorpha]KAG7913575.1 hypothetical protein KL907_000520 [Ogataea polymorpha]